MGTMNTFNAIRIPKHTDSYKRSKNGEQRVREEEACFEATDPRGGLGEGRRMQTRGSPWQYPQLPTASMDMAMRKDLALLKDAPSVPRSVHIETLPAMQECAV
jgi:hypothetical protein